MCCFKEVCIILTAFILLSGEVLAKGGSRKTGKAEIKNNHPSNSNPVDKREKVKESKKQAAKGQVVSKKEEAKAKAAEKKKQEEAKKQAAKVKVAEKKEEAKAKVAEKKAQEEAKKQAAKDQVAAKKEEAKAKAAERKEEARVKAEAKQKAKTGTKPQQEKAQTRAGTKAQAKQQQQEQAQARADANREKKAEAKDQAAEKKAQEEVKKQVAKDKVAEKKAQEEVKKQAAKDKVAEKKEEARFKPEAGNSQRTPGSNLALNTIAAGATGALAGAVISNSLKSRDNQVAQDISYNNQAAQNTSLPSPSDNVDKQLTNVQPNNANIPSQPMITQNMPPVMPGGYAGPNSVISTNYPPNNNVLPGMQNQLMYPNTQLTPYLNQPQPTMQNPTVANNFFFLPVMPYPNTLQGQYPQTQSPQQGIVSPNNYVISQKSNAKEEDKVNVTKVDNVKSDVPVDQDQQSNTNEQVQNDTNEQVQSDTDEQVQKNNTKQAATQRPRWLNMFYPKKKSQ